MELWDIYDEHRMKTGKTMSRGKLPDGCYHTVVHVCIFNSKGEMLIQQRQPFKLGWSNMWDLTVSGSATAGDTSQAAVSRELFEEIGYTYDFSNMRPSLTINFNQGFDDFYLIRAEVDIKTLVLQYEEVQNVKWAANQEIIEMIDSDEFVPYYRDFVNLLFAMNNNNLTLGCAVRPAFDE